jgi:hypothetical protein
MKAPPGEGGASQGRVIVSESKDTRRVYQPSMTVVQTRVVYPPKTALAIADAGLTSIKIRF